jgi:hypothetical protein
MIALVGEHLSGRNSVPVFESWPKRGIFEASKIPGKDRDDRYPWASSQGYQVTDDWWILNPDGKQLLMLPPPWQSDMVHQVWKGKYLALLHPGLLEPVILELEP